MLTRIMAAIGCCALALAPVLGADAAQANAYDDAWQAAWVTHCKAVYSTAGKTTGFTLQVGDSITHANPYSQWPRYGSGKTAADTTIITWLNGTSFNGGSTNDVTNKSGFYLAVADTSGIRGMTASSGMDTAEFLSGSGNGGTAMPSDTNPTTARTKIADGVTYSRDLHITTLIAAFSDAQFVVLMLGTNDIGVRTAAQMKANLDSIITAFEAQNIVVILSTIPPHFDSTTDITAAAYSAEIRSLAQARSLPLIDFRAEILARRSGTTWNGTLLGLNDVHPTATGGTYNAASDPYADGGNPATHSTGAACENSGYLLRSWLTIQKMKEVKATVVDAPPPVNVAPVANAGSDATITLPASASLVGSATDDGLPTATLTYAWIKSSGPGTVTFTNASAASTTASFSVSGTYVLQLTASDSLLTHADLVTITVNPVVVGNVAPVANAQAVTTSENTAKSITLSGSDANADPLTFAVVTAPAHGTVTGAGATRTYTPTTGYSGPDSFTFKVNDGSVDSPVATVSITVTPAAPAGPPAVQKINGAKSCGAGSMVACIFGFLTLSLWNRRRG